MSAPYIPFYTSDFLGGTSGLTASTKGVYITLLCMMYEEEGPLPQRWETLARRCGCSLPAFKRAVEDLTDDKKMVVLDGGLWSPKCDKHLGRRVERRASATSAAKKRWEKSEEKQGEGDADGMRKPCLPEPEPEPDIEEPKGSLSSDADEAPKAVDEVAYAVNAYNATASECGWPKVQVLSKARRAALKARLRECEGLPGWKAALAKARASDHCNGQNARGWVANFDFISRQSSFAKLMEGNYDNRTSTARPSNLPENRADPALAQIARLAGLGGNDA